MMLTKPKPYQYHKKKPKPATPTPAIPPTLVSATYEAHESVTLTFDRPVDASAMVLTDLVVNDGEIENYVYEGATVEALSPTSVRVALSPILDHADAGLWLTAAPGNGVVAVEGGAMWAGVTEYAMPFEGES